MEKSRMSTTSFGSPMRHLNPEKMQLEKRYILKKLHCLFVFYASRASRYSFKEINEKCFMELMTAVFEEKRTRLIKNSEQWKEILSIYYGKGRKISMDYQSFLKCLPAISLIFNKQFQGDRLKDLLEHLSMVYAKYVESEIEGKIIEFKHQFSIETSTYIEKLQKNLYKVYKIYFPQEIKNHHSFQQPVEEYFDRVVLLLKEFQIYPKIISGAYLYLIFLQIVNSPNDQNPFGWLDEKIRRKDRVSSFGFSRFLELLVRISMVCINRLREVECPQWYQARQKECLKALFEYMQGVRVKAKYQNFKHVRFSLILYEEYIDEKEKLQELGVDQDMKVLPCRQNFFELFQKMQI